MIGVLKRLLPCGMSLVLLARSKSLGVMYPPESSSVFAMGRSERIELTSARTVIICEIDRVEDFAIVETMARFASRTATS